MRKNLNARRILDNVRKSVLNELAATFGANVSKAAYRVAHSKHAGQPCTVCLVMARCHDCLGPGIYRLEAQAPLRAACYGVSGKLARA